MWLFVDESWSPAGRNPAYGVLLGVLLRDDQLGTLEDLLFTVRQKYYGREHAKDLRRELKGKDLLSNAVLRLWKPRAALPRNLCIVRELLTFPPQHPDFYLRIFASTVYSPDHRPPSLLSPDPRRLAEPFRHLVRSASEAAHEEGGRRTVRLVFDQRFGADKDTAIAARNFVGGMQLSNVHLYPYMAISNVSPGVQVADIMAHLLSKRVQRIQAIMGLYEEMRALQWVSGGQPVKYGLRRFDEIREDGRLVHRTRRCW